MTEIVVVGYGKRGVWVVKNSYVCIHNTVDERYEVGFFDTELGWVLESIHSEAKLATNRAIYLNGGNGWIINYLEERLNRIDQIPRYVADNVMEGSPSESDKRAEMEQLVQLLKGEWQMKTLSLN